MKRWLLILLVLALLATGGAIVVRELTKTEAARLQTVQPQVRAAYERLRALLEQRGVESFVVSAGRTAEQQAAKVAAKLSDTNNSWHRLGRALDLWLRRRGESDWDKNARDAALYAELRDAAPLAGFSTIAWRQTSSGWEKKYLSGGAWDAGHIQFTEGLKFADAAALDAARGYA